MTDPHTIGRSLSPAMCATILKFRAGRWHDPYNWRDPQGVFSFGSIMQALLSRRLIERRVGVGGFSEYRLTPFGQSVRAIIEEERI